MTEHLFIMGLIALSIGSVIWVTVFFNSLQDYEEYCETARAQGLETPLYYYTWESGRYINITFIALCFLWIPFIDHSVRKIIYPFAKQKITYHEAKRLSRSVSRSLYERLYGLVLGYFTRVNRKVSAKISLWFMKIETFEHVHLLTKVFKWIVFPSSVIYGLIMFIFFELNVLDSILLAALLFVYSNFVPDLPAIFRRKAYRDIRESFHEELPKYKTYALLLFAPVFITLLFCGKKVTWKTTETFHNFKSLAVYGAFLFSVGFLVLVAFPISIGRTIEVVWVAFLALLGYLTHLKVDEVF
ncbi:MAG: hypothetical protein NWF06_06595 [Candidatus Bathyarchaeota archaeon]|nr:hypothetical protein [Candidatus Bathyarchaeum sp.]